MNPYVPLVGIWRYPCEGHNVARCQHNRSPQSAQRGQIMSDCSSHDEWRGIKVLCGYIGPTICCQHAPSRARAKLGGSPQPVSAHTNQCSVVGRTWYMNATSPGYSLPLTSMNCCPGSSRTCAAVCV